MKTAYLDAFSGLSGDMLVGALLDVGADFAELERALATLGVGGYQVSTRRRVLSGISALKFDVEVRETQPERHFGEIRAMIERSALAPRTRERAIAVFEVLADAEARIHQTTPERVHFHEVGAVDSIIDVVGTVWALDALEVGRVLVSPLPGGSGFVRSEHGVIPVPAPATAELLRGFPLRIGDGAAEMVTPTAAAVLRVLAEPARLPLVMDVERVGYGAGTRTLEDRPNLLRVMLGQENAAYQTDELVEVGANIDDLNPQVYDHVMERLFAAGARDVTITPTIMKKGRPAVTLAVLVEAAHRDAVARVLFIETSTIGLRFHRVARLKLAREMREVETRFGTIRIKVSRQASDGALNLAPEYDDCRRAALAHKVALRVVMDEAHEAARKTLG